MRTTIEHGELWVAHDGISWPTRMTRPFARQLAADIRRITTRDPKQKRWAWSTEHGFGRFEIVSSPTDPWPILIFHGIHEIHPTASELPQFVEKLDDYGHGRKR